MSSFKRDKKEEEDGGGNPFQNIEKTTVLQEARVFNDTTVNPRKCTHILTKLLYLLNQGEQLGTKEATDAFFAMTKLFQSRDVILRRMVYLGIKELSSIADDVIIVTSSLTKDMTGKEDLYRAAAIRALCSITDATMLQTIERYMKQAIVDRNSAVSSAALVSSLHLTKLAPEVVKRWVNEAQEAVNSDNIMVQYHALGLLYHIRKTDRLAVTKLVAKLTRISLKSPYAVCMLIRIAAKLLDEEDTGADSPLADFIESCLRHKSEMVVYEAAHAIVNLRRTTSRELAPAISVLQLFCGSPKPTLRFAAVRTLNQVAISHPAAVTACNLDLENLITDSNRSIATLAITTLLKTGAESSVDRLMKQIATFVSEISDEFKVVVVQAIRALALKFPRKHSVLMNFLSAMLRDEGGLEYKASIADTIITIIEDNPEAKEAGLAHLCEFIEDCEHTSLAVRILHLLGKEGPRTKQPSRCIRFIYNRVILENPTVRAAAVSAMAQFGATCPDLLENIQVLLARCQMDSDDEVRDRATYYSSILGQQDKGLYNNYILETLQVSIPALERSLKDYALNPGDSPFDMKSVPIAVIPTREEAEDKHKADGMIISSGPPKPPTVSREESFAEKLGHLPGVADLGPLFKSSEVVELTESETEYFVRCIKHCFTNHVVLQFDCLNTLSDQLLEDVRVQLDPSEGYTVLREIACPKLPYNETGSAYVVLQFPENDLPNSVGTFGAVLKFIVKDCDPNTGLPDTDEGYDDEYMLEDLEITLGDQIQKINKVNWGAAWDEAVATCVEMEDTYSLSSMSTLEEAVKNIVQFLGLQPAERTDKVPEGKTTHTLLLAGMFRGGIDILVRAKLALADGVTMQLTVRSTDGDVAELITSTVG
ncbi:coatomer subunit gamma [Tribolium castaneum]|uniref:Coatomer subunit gamma n=1 Tax=Tribolium castaneum TaxID=7070 RepID=D6WZN0_TRICA|nr:PREDICTED: coatomer subunit gamma [Tribolium castaneum]EFA09678.1 Coatomer subunit gamma-like Protein [Tribolium castaneum]|eukprot:XP_973414.1 PREDICTED: coatomer subunit gamma [Tribolium castaneum]